MLMTVVAIVDRPIPFEMPLGLKNIACKASRFTTLNGERPLWRGGYLATRGKVGL
ncbi:hypothetical protein [Lacipirellula limnantheis]|uniref:hypothetical protein n=1 Tax=Lacipirellula limnantheis TaxID=2528024 RepID=UPI00143D1E41|nr:hypothetical protein [Lacipirellula limnantheis]